MSLTEYEVAPRTIHIFKKIFGFVWVVFAIFFAKPEPGQPDQHLVGLGWINRIQL